MRGSRTLRSVVNVPSGARSLIRFVGVLCTHMQLDGPPCDCIVGPRGSPSGSAALLLGVYGALLAGFLLNLGFDTPSVRRW
jgi:hypothetical protein